jgi:glycine reductase complex component B subunit gamma
LERKGITTIYVTALYNIAERVGVNRIMRAGGKFHHPFGNPDLPKEMEFQWRRKMVASALKCLTQSVDKPTVFTPDDVLS